MKKIIFKFVLGVGLSTLVISGCATTPSRYHTALVLKDCKTKVDSQKFVDTLIHEGFLRSSEKMGPYEVFQKPKIIKKSVFASEPYEDGAGTFGVAVCLGEQETYILAEEISGCEKTKNCTKENQEQVQTIAQQKWGCTVEHKESVSKAWGLENRQDWTRDSCKTISKLYY